MCAAVTSPSPAPSGGGSDWPAQVADTIVGYVDQAREKTTGPATKVARTVVYGTLAALLGSAALVLGLVFFVRVVDVGAEVALDAAGLEKAGRSTWIAHLIVGGLFSGVGLLVWKRGTSVAEP